MIFQGAYSLFTARRRASAAGETSDAEDKRIIREVLSGNKDSFAVLFGKYRKRAKAMGASFFKNETDSEDFVQDVFIKVYTNLRQFRGESKFSTWFTRIAYNTAVNSLNRRKEYVSLSAEAEIADSGETPEEAHLRRVTKNAVKKALEELPEKYRICLDLYFFYDMPYNDISNVTELPLNTIKSHIFRAKKLLREQLQMEDL